MRIGGTILTALLLVGACSPEATPREPTASPPSATTSATPTAVAPTMPPQASEDSPEGAAAFVKHYVDILNFAATTGDVQELSRLSSPDCKGCQRYITLYRDTYAAGGYFKGGEWKMADVQVQFAEKESLVTAPIKSDQSRYRKSADQDELAGRGIDSTLTFGVSTSKSGRTISQMSPGDPS